MYDPFFWGYPGLGAGIPLGGYSMYEYGGGSRNAPAAPATGRLRLKVKPREAEVLVDGLYVGRVDDVDGIFQRLELEPGAHRIELRAEGYQPLEFDVRIPIDDTITYSGELQKTTR
jgi:hypothetical protein